MLRLCLCVGGYIGEYVRNLTEGRRRRTALSGICPDLLCGVCQSKSEILRWEGFRLSEFELDFLPIDTAQ